MRFPTFLAAVLALGCGARTEMALPEAPGASELDSSPADVPSIDTAIVVDEGIDAPLTEVGCTTDLECDDGIGCTDDRCDPVALRCVNVPIDARCDDGLFCNGDERCTVGMGCMRSPRACADVIGCTVDACDEIAKTCVHRPDDKLCPISHGCDPSLGCQARAYAQSPTTLYEIRLPSGIAKKLGATSGVRLTDIALHPSGTLYGIATGSLYTVDISTGVTKLVASTTGMNCLDAAPDGTLYGAGGDTVYVIDRITGGTKPVARFPSGTFASGDLAFLGPRFLATATTSDFDDTLVEFDLAKGTAKPIGRTGFRCIWGLAAFGPTLYGLTCEGRVLRIDPDTGKAAEVSKVAEEWWGASAR